MKDVTILFLRRDNQVLLAMKKRGFGQGKWNGAGGKVEPGETIEQAAIRETQEEIGVTPHKPMRVGQIKFYLSAEPDFAHHAHVFVTNDWSGEPTESEEMCPQWFTLADIPYDRMWVDDVIWLPMLLAGKLFLGDVVAGPNDELISHTLHEVEIPA